MLYTRMGAGLGWSLRGCSAVALSNMQSAHSRPQDCCRLFAWAFILACVFLLGFKMPRGSVEGFPLFVSPWGTLKSDPSPCSQCKLMAWRFLCSFFRRWLHLFKFFFFPFSPSAFNFLVPLTSVFSAFFHSFLFSLCCPLPHLGFWFLVTCSPDSFLFRNHYSCPWHSSHFVPVFFFLTTFPLAFIPFPAILFHLLEPVSWHIHEARAPGDPFSMTAVGMVTLSPFCPRAGICWWAGKQQRAHSVIHHHYFFFLSVVHSAFLGSLLCGRPWGGFQTKLTFPLHPLTFTHLLSPGKWNCLSLRCSSQKLWKLAPFLKKNLHNQSISKSYHCSLKIYPESNNSSLYPLLLHWFQAIISHLYCWNIF